MIKIDPHTAVIDKKEPMATLQSFRAQTDEEKIKVDGRAPVMGIYCGLYLSGNVKIGDDVFIHLRNIDSSTIV